MCVCASVGELGAQINKSSKLEAVDISVFQFGNLSVSR